MIVVTGTKRSGTSMWMQLMHAAGLPVIGEKFMRNWETTIRDANPHGFYESPLRRGVYYQTNPEPRTGVYLRAEEVRDHALKVFIPGLVRTERAYLHRVVATVRNWREYGPSLERLQRMEVEAREREGRSAPSEPVRLPPILEWWRENHMLIRDVAIRQYPVFMVTYDQVLADPTTIVPRVFQWIGAGDGQAAAASVDRKVRTQQADNTGPVPGIEDDVAEVFDELYRRIHEGVPLDAPFIETLNETDERLAQPIAEGLARVRADAARRRRAQQERRRARGAAHTEAPVDDSHDHGLDADEPLLDEREPEAMPKDAHDDAPEDDDLG